MGHGARKPVFGASDQVRLNSVSSATVTSRNIESLHGASVTPIHKTHKTIAISSLREQSIRVVSVKYISLINVLAQHTKALSKTPT